MKIVVLGASGMLGNAVFRYLVSDQRYTVWGTVRSSASLKYFSASERERLVVGLDVLSQDDLLEFFMQYRPDVVINCTGLIKQLSTANDPLAVLPINALLPHRLQKLAQLIGARLVHISTDCVYAGTQGQYVEADVSDAEDLYGKSKYIGEVHDSANAITLRTSIIGHELSGSKSLVDWFLSQSGSVKGYQKAIFSGLPTVEMARVIADYVLPNAALNGLYHVSAEAIDKYSLLKLVAEKYGKTIDIVADDAVAIDRSLDSSRFRQATGYLPPSWADLIVKMRDFK
ncbi:SDR family oxidoreductase [Pseudomonas kermanshahensis]|jgi:dTDP-4-dehydrorhamnose reductase|uniref:dTDP-4-dehydrorhamnose reductase n=1 Tax=Pseudomonas kermanshahensis TaxID=2745482 RepID=A0ABU8R9F9_9PSED|nr:MULTISPECIES: SDR family oxidoreductase [Pseudomonas]MCX2686307.1 SDR family oxidoreductase [Pseudomonas sp. DCB_AW]WEL56873.1 SDR family oxidoreductase [Pseudomonas kermanshahensis]GHS82295.1 NAD(P)-dependent oxidoreductase [Pseudomonas sp. PAGU 2196]